MDTVLWLFCLGLGGSAAVAALGNWLALIQAAGEAAWRGHSRRFSFAPPLLCGLAGAVACLACPWPGVWWWAWLPVVLDPSILLLLAASVLHLVARVFGRPSPFDAQTPEVPASRVPPNRSPDPPT